MDHKGFGAFGSGTASLVHTAAIGAIALACYLGSKSTGQHYKPRFILARPPDTHISTSAPSKSRPRIKSYHLNIDNIRWVAKGETDIDRCMYVCTNPNGCMSNATWDKWEVCRNDLPESFKVLEGLM